MKDFNVDSARFESIGRLLAPRSVAIIGASSDANRIGGRPLRWLREGGFAGKVYPVNPNRKEILGYRCYPSISALPEVVDVAIIALPASHVADSLNELGAAGTKATIIFSSGFSEIGEGGAALEAELLEIASRYGMRLLGPNTIGAYNGRNGWFGTFSASLEKAMPREGCFGIISQSGAFGTSLAIEAYERGLGSPLCVLTGNEADVSVGEVIGWMAGDPQTKVIMVYAEGIRNGPQFLAGLEAARRAAKPVVVLKVGRSQIGSHAAQSHTASIAGEDAVIDAVMREFGVIRAKSAEQMLDFAYLASFGALPAVNSFGVMTASGGAGVLMSDVAEDCGLAMPEMPEAAQARLRALLPYAAFRNPVDCTASVSNDHKLLNAFLDEILLADYGAVAVVFGQAVGLEPLRSRLFETLEACKTREPGRLIVLVGACSIAQRLDFDAIGIPIFSDANRAVEAIAALVHAAPAIRAQPIDLVQAVEPVLIPQRRLSEAEAKTILSGFGIPMAREALCADAEAAVTAANEIGYPVVAKIVSPQIAHKTEIGGVLLDLATPEAVRAAFATIMARAASAHPEARLDGVLIARQMTGGTELIMGVQNDPMFGPVAMVGMGGIFTEILKDAAFLRCPFSAERAGELILSIKAAPILAGARGRARADIAAAAETLSKLSHFAAAAGTQIKGIDLNPVLVFEAGKGVCALDALIDTGAA